MSTKFFCRLACVLAMSVGLASSSNADVAEYYIAVDSRTTPANAPTNLGGGAYPSAPNHNRLTFLYEHVDHFHGIGQHSYSGPAANPTLMDTNANNRLPETYTGQLPLPLVPGAGAYAGKNVSAQIEGVEYSDLEIRNIQSLDPSIPVELTLFNSSSERWNKPINTPHIHLKLISVSSPDLKVGTLSDPSALPVGGDVHVGDGSEHFSFTPVLWVDAAAPAGKYSAEFQLLDKSGTYGDSGRFFFDVRQVPEPTSVGVAALALLASYGLRRVRRS